MVEGLEMWQIKQRQGLPLDVKVVLTKLRIREWYEYYSGKVYVSFSGGKDSTILLHIVRELYPNVEAVFFDTGLEFPEIRSFVKDVDNVVWVKPKMNFVNVLQHYGYPIISKGQARALRDLRSSKSPILIEKSLGDGRFSISKKWRYLMIAPFPISEQCCDVMKIRPAHGYERMTGNHPILGTMAIDSTNRLRLYRTHGCNAFTMNRPISQPISFWTNDDIWLYIRKNNLLYSKIYDMGQTRTGCMFCLFGLHFERKPNRLDKIKETHPKIYNYMMDKLGFKTVLEWYPKRIYTQ